MHLPHVAGHRTYLEPPERATSGFHPLAQSLQWHQLELTDAIAFTVNQGPQLCALDLEFGARVAISGPRPDRRRANVTASLAGTVTSISVVRELIARTMAKSDAVDRQWVRTSAIGASDVAAGLARDAALAARRRTPGQSATYCPQVAARIPGAKDIDRAPHAQAHQTVGELGRYANLTNGPGFALTNVITELRLERIEPRTIYELLGLRRLECPKPQVAPYFAQLTIGVRAWTQAQSHPVITKQVRP